MPVAARCHVLVDPLDPTLAAALVVGATSSVHCWAMCGPLACVGVAAQPVPETRNECAPPRFGPHAFRAIATYHAARIAAYALTGGLFGLLGVGASRALSVSIAPIAPWALAAVLVLSAVGLHARLGRVPGASRVVGAVGRLARRLPPVAKSGVLGAITPLLPCALLWSVLAATTATASFGHGAAILAAFAAGSAPALFLAQASTGLVRLGRRPGRSFVVPVVQLVAAAVVIYRALAVTGGSSACCH